VGKYFTAAGIIFTRAGLRSAKCDLEHCLKPGGHVFGKHSYAFTHFEQHAVACLRNATIPTKEAQAEIVEARKAAEAEEAQCMWLLEETSVEVEFISGLLPEKHYSNFKNIMVIEKRGQRCALLGCPEPIIKVVGDHFARQHASKYHKPAKVKRQRSLGTGGSSTMNSFISKAIGIGKEEKAARDSFNDAADKALCAGEQAPQPPLTSALTIPPAASSRLPWASTRGPQSKKIAIFLDWGL
jgi:hypothetical protein